MPFAGSRVLPLASSFFLLLLALLCAPASFAQDTLTKIRPRQQTFTAQSSSGGAVQFSGPAGQDLFSAMIASSASLDTDSPVTVRAEFDPPTAALGGRVVFRVVVTALEESVKLPEPMPAPAGLVLTAGGHAQSHQLGPNGRFQPVTTYNYRAAANAVGAFTIPAFSLLAYGKEVKVPEARLNVVPAGTPGMHEAPQLRLELPEGDIFVDQLLRVSVSLVDGGEAGVQGLTQPRIVGDSILSEPLSTGFRVETVNREGREARRFSQEMFFTPTRSGDQTIVAQANAICIRQSPFQAGSFGNSSVLVDSDPVSLPVKPLPRETELPGFTGAVGTFQVEAPKLSTNRVSVGEPLILNVTVGGEGNLLRLSPPRLPVLRDWQTFPPVVQAQRSLATFSYTLIPMTASIKATPAIPFSCFDPKKKAYVDLTIPPLAVTVKSVAGLAPQTASQLPASLPGADESARERALALTGLAEKPGRVVPDMRAAQTRWWFWVLQLVPATGLALIWVWASQRRYLEEHPEVARKRRARRGLRRELRLARRAAASRDAAGFASRGINALREACAPHAAANPESLVCADVLRELPAPERQGPNAEVIRRFFAAGDALRYGGAPGNGADLLTLQPDLERLLEHLRMRL